MWIPFPKIPCEISLVIFAHICYNKVMSKLLGIDVGSTTVKVSVIGEDGEVLSSSYVRHLSRVRETVLSELEKIRPLGDTYRAAVTAPDRR